MPFQSTVRMDQAFGVPGEIIFDSPLRAQPYTIAAAAVAANCVVGRVFCLDRTTRFVSPGGDLTSDAVKFAGIMSSPKQYAATGVAGDPLAPSLLVDPGSEAEFVSMGMIVITTTRATKPGDIVIYNTTTGVVDTMDVLATPPAGYSPVPNAEVHRSYTTDAAGGLVVAKLTN